MQPREIKVVRKRLGLTQEQLAELLQVPTNTVARWERGEMKPAGATLGLALRALEIEHLKKSTKANLDEAERTMNRIRKSR
ncbi:MAG TPA: helix-turn-helix domain-containing protein [Blastocatellia bacterium]|nr:helix-turn-helix domain-containing protein [Blastocatellia bacterium]